MSYSAKVIADSISDGVRLITMETTFPRYILAEVNTHRDFSRNSASSRAIPVKTRVQQVRDNPFVPEFTRNKSGMQADAVLIDDDARNAEALWRGAATQSAQTAMSLAHIEVHKQQANRVLEPYAWHTALITSTYWDNFFNLRNHKDAAPEMQKLAALMYEAKMMSIPRPLQVGEWHLPYVEMDKHALEGVALFGPSYYLTLAKTSVARCAAVSFERQAAVKTAEEYAARHDILLRSGHMSPFEHQAKVADASETRKYALWKYTGEAYGHETFQAVRFGNFAVPWLQYRKTLHGEDVFRG